MAEAFAGEASAASSGAGASAGGGAGAGMTPMDMASTGSSILGNLFQGITGLLAGQRLAKQYKNQARQDEAIGSINAQLALSKGDEVAARAATQAAANGGGLGGSSLGVIGMASQRAMFNARTQIYRGITAANADLYNAKVASQNGVNAMISSVFKAGSSGISGFADAQSRQNMQSASAQSRGDAADPYAGLY